MNDFEDKLNSLLSDPDAMGQILQLAQALGGGETASPDPAPSAPPPPPPQPPPPPPPAGGWSELSGWLGGMDPAMLGRLLPLLREWNRPQSGETAQLLLALRPFLKLSRQEKVEQAIRLSRLLHLGRQLWGGGK